MSISARVLSIVLYNNLIKTDPAHRLYYPAHIMQINLCIIQGVSITRLSAVQQGCQRCRLVPLYTIYVAICAVQFFITYKPLHKIMRKTGINNRLALSQQHIDLKHTFTADNKKRD